MKTLSVAYKGQQGSSWVYMSGHKRWTKLIRSSEVFVCEDPPQKPGWFHTSSLLTCLSPCRVTRSRLSCCVSHLSTLCLLCSPHSPPPLYLPSSIIWYPWVSFHLIFCLLWLDRKHFQHKRYHFDSSARTASTSLQVAKC